MNSARSAGTPGLLRVRVTRKAYRAGTHPSLEVLRDVCFALSCGEIGVLVGPSGCGKTTILRVIAGLDTDFEGRIDYSGRGKLAMVFQEPRLLPWRTVEDNVRLVAPEVDESTLALLFRVLELNQHRLHYPSQLSLGLARRVALARAFAVKPDLLLLDEPFVSLDDALAARLAEELVLLVETCLVTTLMVTHNVDEAARLADQLILLSPRPARMIAKVPITMRRVSRADCDIVEIKSEVARRLEAASVRWPGADISE